MTDEEPKYRDWQKELEEAGLLQPGTSIWKDGSGTWFGSTRATCSEGRPILSALALSSPLGFLVENIKKTK